MIKNEELQKLNDIYNYITHRGAKAFFFLTPTVHDIKYPTPLNKLFKQIITDSAYYTFSNSNSVLFHHFKKEHYVKLHNIYPTIFNVDTSVIPLGKEPEIIFKDNYFCMEDFESDKIHIKEGCRLEGAKRQKNNIYVFGNSSVFGYYTDEKHTITHYLQRQLPQYGVFNFGVVGNTLDNLVNQILSFPIIENDIVLIGLYNDVTHYTYFPYINTMEYFDNSHEENFYDIAHYTPICHKNIAKLILSKIEPFLFDFNENTIEEIDIINAIVQNSKKFLPTNVLNNSNVGASVMSCNPFTIGHKHLVNIGSQIFDYFIVFLMQEGMNTIYSKKICEELVRIGVKDFSNVYVVPFPKICSYKTLWPEYNNIELRHNQNFYGLNTYKLLNVVRFAFNQLNVKHFICGIETDDTITWQHITQAKYLFNQNNINVICIPRKIMDGLPSISGTQCREWLINKNYDKLQYFIPNEVLEYIKNTNPTITFKTLNPQILQLQDKIRSEKQQKDIQTLNIPVIYEDKFIDAVQIILDGDKIK